MTSIDHGRLVRGLIPALLEAGRIEMAYFQAGVSVEHKSDRSPVTAADREAEACLLQALGELSPGVPVVAEEEVAEGRVPELGAVFFLVDPLDGTREFIAGRPEFTINVGMVMDGHPRFGMLYVPATGELFATTGRIPPPGRRCRWEPTRQSSRNWPGSRSPVASRIRPTL